MKRFSYLEKSFYQQFSLLIILPILVILLAALGIMRDNMWNSSVDNIRLMHSNAKTMLDMEISDASLSLSHFLQSNDNRMLELMTRYLQSGNQSERYEASKEMEQAFKVMFQPKSQIIAIQFISRNGEQYCLKDDVALSSEELRGKAWYQSALENPDRVFVAVQEGPVTFAALTARSNNAIPIVAAFAPGKSDRGGEVEMVCLYIKSEAPKLLEKYNAEAEIEGMFLIDSTGELMQGHLGEEGAAMAALSLKEPGEYRMKIEGVDSFCALTSLSKHPIRIASVSSVSVMLKGYHQLVFLVSCVAILIFVLIIVYFQIFSNEIIKPIDRLNVGMQRVQKGDLSGVVEASGHKELRGLTHNFNKMTERIQELIEITRQQEKEKHQAEMKALQSQINPHFLVNTLNTMRFMAIAAKYDRLRDMSDALIKMLTCLGKSQSSFYTVREEIEILKSYTFLMKIRYSDNFEVKYDILEEALECAVPRLTLQPIVENCIIHGLASMEEYGHIFIKAELENGVIIFTVKDDGIGVTEEKIAEVMGRTPDDTSVGIGIGVSNVNRRMQLLYGPEYGIQMSGAPDQGTTTLLRIPAKGGFL
ncbi:MAG: sensor histidine kinase [Clostridiales bacterium]|jgi:two-component system sensor histidine kinase YesM|nr:sensor histidine kinase [Clostridiales bacterium]